ncbi:MAG TPA: hypothetical protein VJ914_20620 [Pseudonocardiaceae bacterium]|nr:hypothetical protein [Pseudonocardiaceae bacterium]
MRRLGLPAGIATGIVAVAALAVGCAGRPPVSAGGPPSVITAPSTSTGGPDLPNVHLPAGSVPVAGSKVDASGLPPGYPRLVWTEGNGSVIGFFAEQGACSTVGASVISQTGSAVTVRLLQQQPASTKPCPAQHILNKEMTVNLAQPLGGRTVIMQAVIERG